MSVKSYVKGVSTQLSTNFRSVEFDCHGKDCCKSTLIDEKLVELLQNIRDNFNGPVYVSSAFRCETHNANVGGATKSYHTRGQAADIYMDGIKPAEIAKYAESIGILGIGLYETNADGHFVHIDTRATKAFWYGQNEEPRTTFGGSTPKVEEKPEEKPAEPQKKELYRVRKSWDDSSSQLGAYGILKNAQKMRDKAGDGYYVFNSAGEIVYPITQTEPTYDASTVDTSAADPEVMWTYFKSKGLNDYGIAGLMGNLYAESSLRPCNLQGSFEKKLNMTDAEYTAAVDAGAYTNFVNDGAGYGLAQWTYYSLKQDMLNYFKEKNKSISDLNTQMEFLVHQLSTDFKAVWNVLINAKSVREASDAVLLKFERPADQSESVQIKRAEYGQKYFNDFATTQEQKSSTMKYSDTNPPLVCMQTQSTCYKGTSTMNVLGVLWHSTAANNPTLKRYVQPSDNAADREMWMELLGKNIYNNDWNHIDHRAGMNCWIGKLADGTVTTVQTMPWDYKPWGCGNGVKGSCNNGWIQFEICEDDTNNKEYFDLVYQEACQITAYLCNLYNIDPKGTVNYNGVKVPTILCHYDSYKLGLGSNHGDVDHWFPKFGKSMQTAREDVAAILATLPKDQPTIQETPSSQELYRVRKLWEDASSQAGAYSNLENAKIKCDEMGEGYEVYDSKGTVVYPLKESIITDSFKAGDVFTLKSNATYASGKAIPAWLFTQKLYIREVKKDTGNIVFSNKMTGALIGITKPEFIVKYEEPIDSDAAPTFTPYLVRITHDVLNVRAGASTTYKINTQVKKNEIYTIVAEKGTWGKLKSGAGWIHLDYTKKVE